MEVIRGIKSKVIDWKDYVYESYFTNYTRNLFVKMWKRMKNMRKPRRKMSGKLLAVLSRKKTLGNDLGTSELARVLTVLDLTALGVGSTLGLGVYVLAGSVAKNEAGPAVCLSFLVAAIASAVAGLCYAEFAARVPKAGSAYVYSYVSVGEFVAYVIGWNLILEYVIGTASVARGLSNYIDALAGNVMRDTFTKFMPINVNFLSPYPDFFSFVIIMLLAVLLAVGVKESTLLNNLFTLLNLVTVVIVLIAGGIYADVKNWQIKKSDIPPNVNGGEGGFAPFGFAGIMAGAAKCFYGFVGFDCVATTGEEAKNPQRSIPVAIVLSLVIIFLAYFGISTVLTMMWPYFDQDPDAPFPYVFEKIDLPVIKWIVTIGAIFALCTSLLGAMFPLPRILYAMANDGLLFKGLSKVHPKTHTPVIATVLSGLLAGVMATIFDLQQLIDMMSIGTLLAYTIVAVCVLILRYEQDSDYQYPSIASNKNPAVETNLPTNVLRGFGQFFNFNMLKYPTEFSSNITKLSIIFYSLLSVAFCSIIIYAGQWLTENDPYYMTAFVIITIIMVMMVIAIARQPTSGKVLSFKVPWVPTIPCVSVVINLYLMLELDGHTWIRFSIWMLIGFAIYILYGIRNSEERHQMKSIKKNDIGRSSIRSNKVHPEISEENNTTKF